MQGILILIPIFSDTPRLIPFSGTIPEAKTTLKPALQDHLPVSGQSALPAEGTYHIGYQEMS